LNIGPLLTRFPATGSSYQYSESVPVAYKVTDPEPQGEADVVIGACGIFIVTTFTLVRESAPNALETTNFTE